MGWFEDACDWVSNAVEDVGQAFEDAGEAIVDAAEEVVDWVGDTVENVVESVGATITGVGETIVDFGEAVGATLSGQDPAQVWADFGMNALDNMVFDPVDYLTGGDVDLDYDDGQFTADVDLDLGIGAVGLHVGEAGFDASASFDIGVASGSIGFDSSTGFAASGSLGIADGPWPYAEGHLSIGTDGEVFIGGELQATLPIPGGYLGTSMTGELERNEDGSWGASASFDSEFDGPMGTSGYFHADASADLDPGDRSFGFDTNVDAGAAGPGGAHVDVHGGLGAEYDDGRLDATVEEGIDAGFGGAEVDTGAVVNVGVGAGGPSADVDRWADLDLPDAGDGPGGLQGAVVSAVGDVKDDVMDAARDPFAAAADVADDLAGGFIGDAADALGVDVPAPIEEALPAPQDDFSQAIEATQELEDTADDMWDGLGQ